MDNSKLTNEDRVYFIRHKADTRNKALYDSGRKTILSLLKAGRIGIFFEDLPLSEASDAYFEEKISGASKEDKRYYSTYRSALQFFKNISADGGYIIAEYLDSEYEVLADDTTRKFGTIISRVEKGTAIEPFDSCKITLKLSSSFHKRLDYADWPVLLAIRPPFVTICEPTRRTYVPVINSLILGSYPKLSTNLLHPKMVEQMCVEYLLKFGIDGKEEQKLDYCTLRPGKSMQTIDICGVLKNGKTLFAQVKNGPIDNVAKRDFKKFVAGQKECVNVIFCATDENNPVGTDSDGVVTICVNEIFNKFRTSGYEPMLKKMIGITVTEAD